MKVNNIGDQGGKMLLEGISKNNTLKEIVISDNEITQHVLKELRKLKLKVVSDEEEDWHFWQPPTVFFFLVVYAL